MGYSFEFESSEERISGRIEFKEILLWQLIKFLQKALPDHRPISIKIEKD
jgi:hypothetical protein